MYLIRFILKTLQRFSNILGWLLTGRFDRLIEAFRDLYRRSYGRGRRLVLNVVNKLPVFMQRRRKVALVRLLAERYGYAPLLDSGSIRIAIIARDAIVSPRSSLFIRLISPLTQFLLRNKVSFRLYPENTTQFSKDESINICIVQRTAFDDEKDAELLVKNLRDRGTRLVVDTDDAFSFIEQSHPEYRVQLHRTAALNYLIQEADQVWLSVPALATHCHNERGTIEIVPNGLDKRVWSNDRVKPVKTPPDRPLQMLYMGTVSHDEDFDMILPALDETARVHPGSFELTIIGAVRELPDRLWIKRLDQAKTIYPLFVEWFLEQGPFDIGLSPLVDSSFNTAKSDIKCLDYLAAGIVPVVSDILPYQSPELDDYIIRVKNTSQDWIKAFSGIAADPSEFYQQKSKIMPKAQKYLWNERSSAQTARQLDKLLRSLSS